MNENIKDAIAVATPATATGPAAATFRDGATFLYVPYETEE